MRRLQKYLADVHPAAKADLATAFVERCLEYCAEGGSSALVTPQNWLFLGSYKAFRERLLRQVTWNVVAKLGESGFESSQAAGAFTALLIHTTAPPGGRHKFVGLDASVQRVPKEKANLLKSEPCLAVSQGDQLRNPDARVSFETMGHHSLLEVFATNHQGLSTGDNPRFRRSFWEVPEFGADWEPEQSTVDDHMHYGGRSGILFWEEGKGQLWRFGRENVDALHNVDRRGEEAWRKLGVAIMQMRALPATLYTGEKFDTNVAAIVPRNPAHLSAIWCFCKSPEFHAAVRRIDQKLNVTNATLVKVPFDLERWQQVAGKQYPDGLPEPYSDDPTQWLFKGHPRGSTDSLQVAVARLLGYRWPDQEADSLDALADADGIVPIPAVRSDDPAAGRLRAVLRIAFGSEWSALMEDRLLVESGAKSGTSFDDWLRNQFFEQHCKRFHSRPFIWHIWDGRKDGFSVLVNYHKALENLTYSYLGDWITAQSRSESVGADLRLAAAQALLEKLKLILAGEPDYDIFVRWKPLSEQPIGWNPDLNDGVRMNIRPFVEAGILRKPPNIKWTKDRGNEPQRPQEEYPWFWDGDTFTGERVNDRHYPNAEKQSARKEQGAARK